MLKTNTKKARERVRSWIIENYQQFDSEGYEVETTDSFEVMAAKILQEVRRVKGYEVKRSRSYSWQDAFADWCRGLPSMLYTYEIMCYSSCIDILGGILEETEEEKSRFSGEKALNLMLYLVYSELYKAAPDVL